MKRLALAAPMALLLLFLPAFAQEDNATQNTLQLEGPGEEPVIEQLSDKGIYLVELRWPQQGEVAPQPALQIELAFLNASSPQPTEETFPTTETNLTGASTPGASGFTDPSIIDTVLPVESYDIAILDGDGNVLWEKTDQPGLGGSGVQEIDFEGNYTGPTTINVTDIRPGWEMDGTATAEDMTDSVTFTATVVPEFPVAAVLVAAGIAGAIAVVRLKRIM
jgi:hypothetical protein